MVKDVDHKLISLTVLNSFYHPNVFTNLQRGIIKCLLKLCNLTVKQYRGIVISSVLSKLS